MILRVIAFLLLVFAIYIAFNGGKIGLVFAVLIGPGAFVAMISPND